MKQAHPFHNFQFTPLLSGQFEFPANRKRVILQRADRLFVLLNIYRDTFVSLPQRHYHIQQRLTGDFPLEFNQRDPTRFRSRFRARAGSVYAAFCRHVVLMVPVLS